MQLTGFNSKACQRHVFSLKFTGLYQDHGMNAVKVVMDKFDGNDYHNHMFRREKKGWPVPYNLEICSQFTCPWKHTLLTLVVSPSMSSIELYVEQAFESNEKSTKRKRDEEERPEEDFPPVERDDTAMPYMPKGENKLWTDMGNGIKHRSFDGAFMAHKIPNVGVLMSGNLGNAVEIVPASLRIINRIADPHTTDRSSFVFYE